MDQREKLIELITDFLKVGHDGENLVDYLLSHGATIPVRCAECTNAEDAKDCERLYCGRLDMFVKYNWYCACGAKMDEVSEC